MKFILLAVALLLAACDKPPAPKIAAPQREALDKAKAVDQMVQKNTDETRKKIEDADK
ncbi:MAG: hypothetical protein WCA63_00030 [Gallionella sp.]